MKLLSLHIKRYGHFADVPLGFRGDGLQIILGPNEAGKSTLLEFVRELLFGFAERNPYDFGNGRIEGSATLRLASGQLVELHRHKGRKNTVAIHIDGHKTDQDAGAFNSMLGGATPQLFRSVFAFGLKELAAADDSLKHEGVRSALYGGGLAHVVHPKRLLDDLKSEAEKLFKERAQVPVVNALCGELAHLSKQVREKSVRSEVYEQRRDALKLAHEQARQLDGELTRLRQEHSLTKKLGLALPLWLELNHLRRERGELTIPGGFPADGKQQFEMVQREIGRLSREQAILSGEIEQDQLELEKIEVNPLLAAHRASIEHVQQLILSVKEARRDLPLRQSEMERTSQQVQTDLTQWVPGWSLENLRAFHFDAARRAVLTTLLKERQQLGETETELLTRRKGLRDNLEDVTASLNALGEPLDVAALIALLEGQTDYSGNLKELARSRAAHHKAVRDLAALLPCLNPPLTQATAEAYSLPVPPRETLTQFKRDFTTHQQRVATAQQSLLEEEANFIQLQKQLAALHGNAADVPVRSGLARWRGRRDAGWALIRRKYVAGEDLGADLDTWLAGSPRSLPDVYEEVVREADRYADALFDKSSAVAKQEQIEAVRHLVESKRQTLEAHQKSAELLRQRWQDLWRPVGFEPLEPDAMESWLEYHRTLRQLVQQRDQLAEETQTLGEHIAAYEDQLRQALGATSGEGATHLTTARLRVEAARKKEQDRQTLEKNQRRLQEQQRTLNEDVRQHGERDKAWQTRWQAFLGQLRLPVDWSPKLTQEVMNGLAAARAKLEQVPEYERRIASMKQRLEEFDPIVHDLCQTVAPDLLNKPPEVAAAILQERLTSAVAAQERQATLDKNLVAKRKKLRDLEQQFAKVQEHRQSLLRRACVDSDDAFGHVADRAARICALDDAIAAKQSKFELIRENEDPEAFALRLQAADQELLKEHLRDLDIRLEETRKQKTASDEQVGSCRTTLAEFEKGSDEAAWFDQQAASKRALLATEVSRYVPLIFARQLLQKAIERFEQESQPEMLREVTRIFQRMTAGRYMRVERPMDDESPFLVYRHDDKALEPAQLSTGTREQLYLAIRLAYVLHYCNRAEPLPVVMDDVLTNFDDDRTQETLRALSDVAQQVQVIMFTCHPHLVDLARQALPGLQPVEIARPEG